MASIQFKQIPVRIGMRAPMPDGKGGTLAYSSVAMILAEAELEIPLTIEVEDTGDPMGNLQVALDKATVMAGKVCMEGFFRLVDEIEETMRSRTVVL